MTSATSFVTGALLSLGGWLVARWVAHAPFPRPRWTTVLDATPPLVWFVVALLATARPLFAGILTISTFAGLAAADHFKRLVLREPIVFSDSSKLKQLVIHPRLYLPFVGPGRVLAGAAAVFIAFGLLLTLERPDWPISGLGFAYVCVICCVLLALAFGPGQAALTTALKAISVTGDPVTDSATLGPLTTLLVYGVRARAERKGRAAAASAASALTSEPGVAYGHFVLVQCESFLDPRGTPLAGAGVALPHLDHARVAGPLSGRFLTPAHGANTVRTEFEVLTGISSEALGFDRFDPYHAFVGRPLPSLAWSLRARGYRTVCVHPFDGGFYDRKHVLPRLGFEHFYDIRSFDGCERHRGFVTDAAIADFVEALIARAETPTFVFVITMENHGPWTPELGGPSDAAAAYVEGVRAGDDLLGRMGRAVGADRGEGLAALYGDHGPLLEGAGDEGVTDFVIWRAGGAARSSNLRAGALAEPAWTRSARRCPKPL